MTEKKCAFCGSTRNVVYEDPAQGPVCQTCWFVAGDEDEKEEKPAKGRPGEAPEEPDRGSGR
ncbi:MAG: hypothetical protein HYT86_05520 [candidate division NC10 bacterium]|nr:hypothetical protein [candidate division NC10 bacterium]